MFVDPSRSTMFTGKMYRTTTGYILREITKVHWNTSAAKLCFNNSLYGRRDLKKNKKQPHIKQRDSTFKPEYNIRHSLWRRFFEYNVQLKSQILYSSSTGDVRRYIQAWLLLFRCSGFLLFQCSAFRCSAFYYMPYNKVKSKQIIPLENLCFCTLYILKFCIKADN